MKKWGGKAAARISFPVTDPWLDQEVEIMALTLVSSAFENGGEIPRVYTCDGDDVSPPLQWDDLPEGTRSVVLIVDDPDAPDPNAPKVTWVHWVLYNLSPGAAGLPEGVPARGLPDGAREGKNGWNRTGYGGPCPPIGRHRYFHKLYALNMILPDLREPSKAELMTAMERHVIGKAELVGTYGREE